MDIEKLIERLRTESLYKDKATLEIMDLCMEAADALSTLQAELEKVKAERDAAIKDMCGICYLCKNAKSYKIGTKMMNTCDYMQERGIIASTKTSQCPHFEWRGPVKED